MLQKDRVALAMLLAQATPNIASYKMEKDLIDLCLREDLEGADVPNLQRKRWKDLVFVIQISGIASPRHRHIHTRHLRRHDP